jgi:hypothetical protein
MEKMSNFQEFYETELLPALHQVESKRKTLLGVFAFVGLIIIGILVGLAVFVSKEESILYALYFAPVYLILGFAVYLSYEAVIKNSGYYKSYKKLIINKIIAYINPSLHYDKKYAVDKALYLQSGFFPKLKVAIDGDDHVTGVSNGIKVEFSELEARYRNPKLRKEKGEYQFRGIFFVAHAPKPFPADFVIMPRKSFQLEENTEAVTTDNPIFNDFFKVHTLPLTTPSLVQQVLTDDFASKIAQLKSEIHNDIYISFVDNKMFIGIMHDKELFEPNLFSSNINFDAVQTHFKDLYYPIYLIEVATQTIAKEHKQMA